MKKILLFFILNSVITDGFGGISLSITRTKQDVKVIRKFIFLYEKDLLIGNEKVGASKIMHRVFRQNNDLFLNVIECEPQKKDKNRCDYTKQKEVMIPFKSFINSRGEFLGEGDKITLLHENGNIHEYEIVANRLNKDLKYTKKILTNLLKIYLADIKKFEKFQFSRVQEN